MRDELIFSATRNITIGDFTELLRLLNQRGYNVQALDRVEGGICFLIGGHDGGKDVRFHSAEGKPTKDLNAFNGIFTDPPETVWQTYAGNKNSLSNRFSACTRDGDATFSQEEKNALCADIATALGGNRRPRRN